MCCQEIGSGVIYFKAPLSTSDFATELGERVSFDWHISLWSQARKWTFYGKSSHKEASDLDVVLKAITQAAHLYKKKHAKAPVLVVDNLTVLAKQDKAAFSKVVSFAKKEADLGELLVVFVASEGHTPRQLLDSSRLDPQIIEVSDLSEEDTRRYIEFLDIPFSPTQIYDLAGGRMTIINGVVKGLRKGYSYEVARRTQLSKVQKEFHAANILQHQTPEQKEIWAGIVAMFSSPNKVLPYAEFCDWFGSQSDWLLEKNVFAYHESTNTVSFHGRPTELFVEEFIHSKGLMMKE